MSRYPQIGYAAGSRRLSNEATSESLAFTRSDTIYDNGGASFRLSDSSKFATEFFEDVWASVLEHAKPSPNRYGCLIGFSLPTTWHPISALLNEEERETAQFDFRFSKRLTTESALVKATISDYQLAIFGVSCRGRKCRGWIDFQHYFDPALESEKARKENPFPRFVSQAAEFFRGKGWDFLDQRLRQISKAA